MIVLYINVLSELKRPQPAPTVVAWLRSQRRSRLFTTAISRGEMPYDGAAADAHAVFVAERRSQGRSVQMPDAMIAGIAYSRGAALATHNVQDFEGCGITLVDPWH